MKAALIDRFGGAEQLRIGDVSRPEPGPNDVLIRIAYASINPADYKSREGLLPPLDHYPFPITLGMDCSGIVESVGSAVTAFSPGDRIISLSGMGQGYQGTYAEFCCAPAVRTFPLPSRCSMAEGATIPIAAACAANAILVVAPVAAGQQVLVNGGAGSVGSFAIQLLKLLGVRVAATCSTRNIEYVAGLGVEKVIDYSAESIPEALREWAPAGLDVVYDLIGQHSLPADLPSLIRRDGTLVCIMTLGTGVEAFDQDIAAARGVRVIDDIGNSMTIDPAMIQVAPFRTLLAAIDEGKIQVPPYEIMPLAAVADAQQRVAGGHVRGKILLKIADL